MKGSTLFWLMIVGIGWYLYNQQQKNIVGPLLSQSGSAAGGTMTPCAPGWYQGTDQTGNQTCLPVGSLSGW